MPSKYLFNDLVFSTLEPPWYSFDGASDKIRNAREKARESPENVRGKSDLVLA